MKEDELPPGWAWSTLGQVATWGSGGTPKAKNPQFYGGDIPWAVIGDLTDGLVSTTKSTITREGLDNSSAKLVPEGAVLIAMYGSIGKLGIVSREMATNQAIAFAVPNPAVIRAKYLFWYLRSQRDDLIAAGKGGTQQNISQTVLKSWRIAIPPVAEQERIVDALEDHLSRLDAASENLRLGAKRIPALRGGVRSQLVCLNNPTTRLPEGWSWGVLSDVLAEIQAGKSFRCEPRPAVPGEWGIVKVSAMTWGEFRPSENKAVIAGREIEERHEIRPGDILVSRANTREYVGASVIVRTCPPRLLLSDKSLRLVPKPEVDREWLLQVLSSPYVRRQISEKATGTKDSMRNISQKALRQIRIAIPPMGDMESIGADVSAALVQVEELNDSLCRSIARATNLRWGILKRAFSGKLVRQNSSEESASILLERIRADRATQPKLKRRRAAEVVVTSARPAPPVSSDPAGTFVQEELGL